MMPQLRALREHFLTFKSKWLQSWLCYTPFSLKSYKEFFNYSSFFWLWICAQYSILWELFWNWGIIRLGSSCRWVFQNCECAFWRTVVFFGLKGFARSWWRQVHIDRKNLENFPILSWSRMKNKFLANFYVPQIDPPNEWKYCDGMRESKVCLEKGNK